MFIHKLKTEDYMIGKKKKYEMWIFWILISYIIINVIFDIYNIKLISLPITEDEFSSIVKDLFGIQASISTLGIALIALLTESIKEKRYGIRIGHFVMTNHHKLLTHESIIIFEILILIVNYVFLTLEFLNGSVALFIVSLLLVIILTRDILKLFVRKEEIYSEIRTHIVEEIKEGTLEEADVILKSLNDNLIELAYEHKVLELKVNLEIYTLISQVSNQERNSLVDVNYNEAFKRISYINNRDENELLYNSILELYTEANNRKNRVHYFENLFIQIFDVLSSFPQNYYYKENSFPYILLYEQIKKNQEIESEEKDFAVYNYIYYIYERLFRRVDWDENFLQVRVTGFHQMLVSNLKDENSVRDLAIYTKILLDQEEKDVLVNVFFSELEYFEDEKNTLFVAYILSFLLYSFYILNENVRAKKIATLKPFTKELLIENSGYIIKFFHELDLGQGELHNIIKIVEGLVKDWEVYPDSKGYSSSKWIMMDKVARNFFMNLFLFKSYDKDDLLNYIINSPYQIEQLYEDVFINDRKFKNQNHIFMEHFVIDLNTEENFEMLKEVINEIYISKIMNEAECIDSDEYLEIATALAIQTQTEINNQLKQYFTQENHLENELTENIEIINLTAINFFDDKEFFRNWFPKKFMSSIIEKLLVIINDYLVKVTVSYEEKEKLSKLFETLSEKPNNYDTLIGLPQPYLFYNDPLRENYQELLDKVTNIIKLNIMNRGMVLLDSNYLRIEIKNVSIKFVPLTKEKILTTPKVDSLYEFNDSMADRKLLFTEEQLLHLFSLKYRNVTIDLDVMYMYDSLIEGIYYDVEDKK